MYKNIYSFFDFSVFVKNIQIIRFEKRFDFAHPRLTAIQFGFDSYDRFVKTGRNRGGCKVQ